MAYRKLGRNSSNRKALFRSILTSFFKHGRIETTITKAKEVASKSAELITLAKRGDLHARRQVLAFG
jgi:large subunit ribosomal protein L17